MISILLSCFFHWNGCPARSGPGARRDGSPGLCCGIAQEAPGEVPRRSGAQDSSAGPGILAGPTPKSVHSGPVSLVIRRPEPFRIAAALLFFLCLWGARPVMAENPSFFKTLREGMVKEIEGDVKLTRSKIGKTALVPEVMRVMGKVPRHEFVPLNLKSHAYENRPLPIGYGQTISQPYIVALMTDLLETAPGHKVLEIGTGSGYQAAVLAELVGRVYSIEIIPELAQEAQARIKRLGYGNIEIRQGDGYYGWEDQAPFDGIIVTAAGSHIPPPLVQQLKPGGKMVIPVGGSFMTQQLVVVEKLPDGKVRSRQVLPVAFVPLTGGH